MSDTTTLTPEERAELIAHVNSGYMTISGEGLKRALAALEQAEARVVQGKTRAETLRKRLMEQVEYTKTILARAEKAEAMADWLAGQLHGLGPKYGDVICPQEKCHATSDCIDCWKEAARKAVAGEGKEI